MVRQNSGQSLSRSKSRAEFYQSILEANPQNLEQLRNAMLEQMGEDGATPESNRRLNAIDKRINAMSSALSTDLWLGVRKQDRLPEATSSWMCWPCQPQR